MADTAADTADADDGAPSPTGGPVPSSGPADSPSELGAGGAKALEAEREARKAAERRSAELTERLEKIERDQARRQVAADKGLSDAQAAYLTGATREELEASADGLLSAFAPATPRAPAENLRPGNVTDDPAPGNSDPAKVAETVMRGR